MSGLYNWPAHPEDIETFVRKALTISYLAVVKEATTVQIAAHVEAVLILMHDWDVATRGVPFENGDGA